MLCVKFGWNWYSGSGEEDFLISSVYLWYFVIISPWKRAGPSSEQTWILFTQRCFMLCSVQIVPVVLDKKMKIWNVYDINDNDDGRRTTCDQQSSLELSTQVSLKYNGKYGFWETSVRQNSLWSHEICILILINVSSLIKILSL